MLLDESISSFSSLQVSDDASVAQLKIAIANSCGVTPPQQVLFYDGSSLNDSQTIRAVGMKSGDLVMMQKREVVSGHPSAGSAGTAGAPMMSDPMAANEMRRQLEAMMSDPMIKVLYSI